MDAGTKGDFEQRLEELFWEGWRSWLRRWTSRCSVHFAVHAAAWMEEARVWRAPILCPVLKFKMLVLQALHGSSLTQTSYLVA